MKLLTAVGMLLAGCPIVLGQKFFPTCSTVVVKDNTLRGVCKNDAGEEICSVLDLTTCITNDNGYLEPNPDGTKDSYMKTCKNCSNAKQQGGFGIDAPSNIHCDCENQSGRFPTTFLDLNDFVSNVDGLLECYKSIATPCE